MDVGFMKKYGLFVIVLFSSFGFCLRGYLVWLWCVEFKIKF